MTPCILKNRKQVQFIFLLDTNATDIVFVDKAMTCTIYEALEKIFIKLTKLKSFKRFNN